MARPIVQVGEPVRITIQVKDSEEIPQIDAPRAQGMSISSTGTADVTPSTLRNARGLPLQRLPDSKLLSTLRDVSKQLNDVAGNVPNGVDPKVAQQYQAMLKQQLGNLTRNDYAIVYLATPEKIGPVTVPPFTVHSSGQTVQTQPLSLNVVAPRPSPWVRAALSLSNPEPSVGDNVNLYVDLLVRRWTQQTGPNNANLKSQPIGHVTLTVPSLEGFREIQPVERLKQFVSKRRLPPGQLGYHINHFPGVILLEQEPAGTSEKLDPHWYRRRLTIPFRAVQAGEMEVRPLRVAGEVYVPTGGKDRYSWEGFVATSSPLAFHIREGANRPAILAPTSKQANLRPEMIPTSDGSSTRSDAHAQVERSNDDSAMAWLPYVVTFVTSAAVFLVLTPVSVILLRRLAARRQHVAQRSRQIQAIEAAQQRLQSASLTAADVSTSVQDFLRVYLDMGPGEITPEEAAQRLTQGGYSLEVAHDCAEVLRACAAQEFTGSGPMDTRSAKVLALTAERIVNEILFYKPTEPVAPSAQVDEVTRQRQAALTD